MARDWALQLVPRSFVEVGTDHVPAHNGGKCVFPFYEASHVRCRRRAPLLAEPDQTPHITMWHYGCGRLLRCGCAGSMRRERYGGCAGAVVLGYGRSAPLNTGVECLSSPQHRGSKATCRPPCAWGSEKIPKVLTHRAHKIGGRTPNRVRMNVPSSGPEGGRRECSYQLAWAVPCIYFISLKTELSELFTQLSSDTADCLCD